MASNDAYFFHFVEDGKKSDYKQKVFVPLNACRILRLFFLGELRK